MDKQKKTCDWDGVSCGDGQAHGQGIPSSGSTRFVGKNQSGISKYFLFILTIFWGVNTNLGG